MTLSSRVPALLDRLVGLFTGALPGDVLILDGPAVTADPGQDVVCVGWDGDDDGDGQAVDWAQDWTGLGAGVKTETIQVTCVLIAWDGDDDLAAARTRAYTHFAALEAALRADVGAGFAPPATVAITGGRLHQEQTRAGAQARVPFTVSAQIRI
ncbi:hypothetical protein FHS43_000568 [Streptosporangium becharense]|uniref:DUF3168 domain-containing protein n=1 Tax=Streptosporangium becharense TaxID=1816182 RepID=A0A7W9INT0_9ACTN|nr:hypothetical protein [Streptosporangium becharense]MBB2909322.1 hypothetical protein [Streptosporangium becharense]MBB5823775.1 hypothetical protein [Streptosporangium becharense]